MRTKDFNIMMKESAANDAAKYIEQLEKENERLKQKLKSAQRQTEACRQHFRNFLSLAERVYAKKEAENKKLKKEIDLLSAQITALQQYIHTYMLEQRLNEEIL